MDTIRREVESTNRPQGFHLLHTLGGGTGSGLGSLILLKLQDNYPDTVASTFSVFPSPKVSDTVVEPYNAVLCSHQLLESSNQTYIFDNESLYNINHNVLKKNEPKYADLNHIVNLALMGATAPFRFPGAVDNDLRKQGTSLVSCPRLHFFHLSHSPMTGVDGSGPPVVSVKDALGEVVSPRNFLTNVKKRDGKYLATTVNYRGTDDSFFDMLDQQFQGETVADWIPDNVMGCQIEPTSEDQQASCTMVANTTATKGLFQRLATQFGAMYRRKAFLHWYKGEGMDEMEFHFVHAFSLPNSELCTGEKLSSIGTREKAWTKWNSK